MNSDTYKRIMGMKMIRDRQEHSERIPPQSAAEKLPEPQNRDSLYFSSLDAFAEWFDAGGAEK